jgi:hypothetical protein
MQASDDRIHITAVPSSTATSVLEAAHCVYID